MWLVMIDRLLTLWFEYGEERRVYESLVKGLKLISIENWLQVIPQLIARIDTSRQSVGKLIQTLLCDISKHHPQVSNTLYRKIETSFKSIHQVNMVKCQIHSTGKSSWLHQINMQSTI